MTNERKMITVLLLAALVTTTWWMMRKDSKPKPKEDNILKVGTAAEFPPFEYIENDRIIGFDIDLMGAVAQKLGKKIEVVDLPFTTLIQQLHMGNIDVIAAGLTPTEERAEQVLFTNPYTSGDPLLVLTLAGKHDIKDLNDLKNKKVVVNEGFSADVHMTKHPHIDVKRLPTVADAFMALRTMQSDAFVTARNTLKPFFEQNDAAEFETYQIPDTDEKAAFALAKENEELAKAINAALEALEENGTIATLKKKWKLEE